MLSAISYRVAIECPECAQKIPVNHMRRVVLCPNCQATLDLEQRRLRWWRDGSIGDWTTRSALERPEHDVGYGRTTEHDVEFFHGPATCTGCQQPMTAEALAAAAASGTFTCSCGFTCACRAAEPSLVEKFPCARWLLGEAPDAAGAPDGTHAMMTPCMSCGAGLKVDGTSRTVECTYCNTSNFLPDGLWLRLHPKQQREWFRLIVEVDA